MKEVEDQLGCGSCWAFAASTVLRAHAELYQTDRRFSQQQIVSCTPNPMQCGGEGGCKGATIELAMDYVARSGCATAEELPYGGIDGTCPSSMLAVARDTSSGHAFGGLQFGMTGFQKLPENRLEPLLQALTEQGPVGVSLATGFRWNIYYRGIMRACGRDAVIDHAVALVGYGQQAATKYWLIQNSWGPEWGEGGFVRLHRQDHDKEAAYCGTDSRPEVGSGCVGGPKEVRVCGSCGILYDAVVPTFQLSRTGWWSHNRQNNASMQEWSSTRRKHLLRAHAPGK
jgi:cathepsin L